MGYDIRTKQKVRLRLTTVHFLYGTQTVPLTDSMIGTHELKRSLKVATRGLHPTQVHFLRPSHYLFPIIEKMPAKY